MRLLKLLGIRISLILFGLFFCEIFLHLIGVALMPSSKESQEFRTSRTVESDPLLGWRNKPGQYRLGAESSPDYSINITVHDNGARATSQKYIQNPEIEIVGCSYTFGYGLSDNQTLPWMLEESTGKTVGNFGVSAFGTLQSYLMLKKNFEIKKLTPKRVLYLFADFHAPRNILNPGNFYSFARTTMVGNPIVPYAELGEDNQVIYHNAQNILTFPLREHLATAALLQKFWLQFKFQRRVPSMHIVTQKIISDMNTLSLKHKAKFAVVGIRTMGLDMNSYSQFFNDNNIEFIDCSTSLSEEPSMTIGFDTHPNEKMYSYWNNCLLEKLPELTQEELADSE